MNARNFCRTFVLILAAALLLPLVVTAQNSGPATIEELYLSQDIDLQVARSQATAESREMKLLALQTIRSMIDEGMANTAGNEISAILGVLASEGTIRQVRTGNNTVVNNFPDIRRQAVELIWQVGGPVAEESMKNVLANDPEPMVLAEAVYGLGMIELENPAATADLLSFQLRRWNAAPSPDNNLAFASLLTIERIANRYPEVAANPELLNSLLGIAAGNYIREVRLKSIDIISSIRNVGR